MEMNKLQVRLFGRCSITAGDVTIEDSGKRASKIWLLIAYLICNRGRNIPPEELIERLWGSESNSNPGGVLKTTLWRARSLLDELWPNAGHDLILNKNNGYEWNTDFAAEVDASAFDTYCHFAAECDCQQEKLSALREAAALYHSDFLEKYSAEDWVEPLTAYYNQMYVNLVLELLSMLSEAEYGEEMIGLARNAMRVSPYQEELYQYLMRALIGIGEYKQADDVYEDLRQLLFANLGVTPGEEIQKLHGEVMRHLSYRALTVEMLREQLQEKEPEPGPLFCEFSVFRQFYQAEARSVSRRGDAVHVGLLSVIADSGKEVSESSLEKAMNQLREQLRCGLRRGDVVSRCSASQYVVLLLQANFENSNKVCDRIVRGYTATYSRPSVRIQSVVLPLEPLQASANPQQPKKRGWNT